MNPRALGPAVLAGALAVSCGALDRTESITVVATFPSASTAALAREVEVQVFALGARDPSPCAALADGALSPDDGALDLEASHTRLLEPVDGVLPASVGFVFDLGLGSKALLATARDATGELMLRGCETSASTPGAVVTVELHAPR